MVTIYRQSPICNVNAALSSAAVGFLSFVAPPPPNQRGGFGHRSIIAVVIISCYLVFLFHGMNHQCVDAAAVTHIFSADYSLPQKSNLSVCSQAVERIRCVAEIELSVELLGTWRRE